MERTVRKLVGRVLGGHVTSALVSVSVGVRMATQAPSVKQVTTPPPPPCHQIVQILIVMSGGSIFFFMFVLL